METEHLHEVGEFGEVVQPLAMRPMRAPRKAFHDNQRPARPATAFVAFSNEHRSQVIKDNPDQAKSVKAVATILGEKWRSLSQEERERYKSEYLAKKEAWDVAMKEYFTANPDAQEREQALKRARKHQRIQKRERGPSAQSGPKRALTAFFFFVTKRRPDVKAELGEKAKPTEITSRVAALWRDLDPEEKKYYEALAAEDKARYQKQCQDVGFMSVSAKRQRTSLQRRAQIEREAEDPEDDEDEDPDMDDDDGAVDDLA